jgi:hypothetical protein
MIGKSAFTFTIASGIITTSVALILSYMINVSRRLKAQKIRSYDKGEMSTRH